MPRVARAVQTRVMNHFLLIFVSSTAFEARSVDGIPNAASQISGRGWCVGVLKATMITHLSRLHTGAKYASGDARWRDIEALRYRKLEGNWAVNEKPKHRGIETCTCC